MVGEDRIKSAKDKLGTAAFNIMASEIPLEEVDEKKLSCKSPFREENTPSAFWYKKGNFLKCFSTGLKMDYIDFLIKYKNKTFVSAVKELFDLVGEQYDDSDFFEKYKNEIPKDFKRAKDEKENTRAIVELYLSRRGISPETLDYCNVKQDLHGNIAYQFYDLNGELIQTKYRVSKHAENKDFKWFWQKDTDKCGLLYGVNRINLDSTLLVVEGMNDRLSCVEAGFLNCVSIPGGANDENWIEFNFEILNKCDDIVLWFDDDVTGQKFVRECADRLGLYKTRIVMPDKEIKNKIRNYYKSYGCEIDKMDANNVLVCAGKDAVIELILKSEAIKNEHLKKLFNCNEVELHTLPYCSSGFRILDKLIFGNFDGTFIVVTGYSGAGKSSLISEMGIIAPIEAGKKVMIYSGEIQPGVLLGNTYRPLAGRKHIIEYDNSGKGLPNGYAVTFEAKDRIKKFYMDSMYFYDDSDSLDCSSESIIESMEYAYRKYNVTFFTLDNLMTISTSEKDDDKYSSQIKFAKKLKSFTRKHPVTVILVAHPKKPAPGQKEVDMYGISGSSEIVNLSDRAFAVGIIKDDPNGYNSYISILKDRQTGKANKKVKLFYDIPSTRIYSDEFELHKEYSWEEGFTPNYPPKILSMIVENKDDPTKEIFGQ